MTNDFMHKTKNIMHIDSENNSENEEDATGLVSVPETARKMTALEKKNKIPCIVVLVGMDMGNIVPIENDKFTIGRDPQCQLVLQDDGISRRHASVNMHVTSSILVKDLKSTNGTFVKGKSITSVVLNPDDKILMGKNTILKFVLQDKVDLAYQKEIFASSTRDGLTGIYNRKYLVQKLINDLSFAKRHNLFFTLIIFDIDHFKKVNDTYGHSIGDKVLIAVTQTIASIIRTEDILGRYGGEEFAVIAQGTDYQGAKRLGERIRESIAQNAMQAIADDGTYVKVTVSVGSATICKGTRVDAQKLISLADLNLYKAKNSGRNNVVATEGKESS